MILLQKAQPSSEEQSYDINCVIFRTAKDNNPTIQDEAIRTLQMFVSKMYPTITEVNKFIESVHQISSIIRMLLLEYKFYDQTSLSWKKNFLSIVLQQEEDIFKHMDHFIQETDLKNKIGWYVTHQTGVRVRPTADQVTVKETIDTLELNSIILLSCLFNIIFYNVTVHIERNQDVTIDKNEFIRLFNRTYMSLFKCGWNLISRLALRDVNNYQTALLYVLTEYIPNCQIDRYVKKQVNDLFESKYRKSNSISLKTAA